MLFWDAGGGKEGYGSAWKYFGAEVAVGGHMGWGGRREPILGRRLPKRGIWVVFCAEVAVGGHIGA